MGILKGIAGFFASGPDKAINAIGKLGDDWFTSDEERLKFRNEILKASQNAILLDIQSGNLFQSGWRPMIGWAGAFAMIYNFIFHPIASVWLELPPVLGDELYVIVTGMLGIGVMRSADKRKKFELRIMKSDKYWKKYERN